MDDTQKVPAPQGENPTPPATPLVEEAVAEGTVETVAAPATPDAPLAPAEEIPQA